MKNLKVPLAIENYIDNLHKRVTEAPLDRYLKDMAGAYQDAESVLVEDNPLVYRFWTFEPFPGGEGELAFGMTDLYPGLVGQEYFMTAGHFHRGSGGEIYVGVAGEGLLLLLTRDGELETRKVVKDTMVYIPSGWAHRMVNIGDETLRFTAFWPTGIEHDYASIRRDGFGYRVLKTEDGPKVVKCK